MTHLNLKNWHQKKRGRQRQEALRKQIVGLLPRLRRFATSLAKDTDQADDLVQAACERALKRLDQLREGSRLDSWLYRIIYTQWIDKMRRRKIRSEKLIILGRDIESRSAQTEFDSRLNASLDIHQALRRLPKEHRAAVMLVCVDGYSYAEAAEVLDVPAGTVASRVSRARIMMGRCLTDAKDRSCRPRKLEKK